MFCPECGSKLKDGARFCENCGAAVNNIAAAAAQTVQPENAGRSNTELKENTGDETVGKIVGGSGNIMLCLDGKYRWVYELNLLKNPTIFVLVWKIFFFILLGIFVIMTVVGATDGIYSFGELLLNNLKFAAYFLIGMTVLCGLGYLLYAAIMGGKYCVMFEMDENGINHKQMPKQAKKAQIISVLTVLAGLASGRLSTVGVGLNSARTEMYSDFSRTRKVKSYPRRGLIKVNGLLSHNQVYTEKEDFDFVNEYIISHCTNLK